MEAINSFANSPMFIIAIIVFIICIIIGFFGDRRLKKEEKLNKIMSEEYESSLKKDNYEKSSDKLNVQNAKNINQQLPDQNNAIEQYVVENTGKQNKQIQNLYDKPVSFDESIKTDDNVNNMF